MAVNFRGLSKSLEALIHKGFAGVNYWKKMGAYHSFHSYHSKNARNIYRGHIYPPYQGIYIHARIEIAKSTVVTVVHLSKSLIFQGFSRFANCGIYCGICNFYCGISG